MVLSGSQRQPGQNKSLLYQDKGERSHRPLPTPKALVAPPRDCHHGNSLPHLIIAPVGAWGTRDMSHHQDNRATGLAPVPACVPTVPVPGCFASLGARRSRGEGGRAWQDFGAVGESIWTPVSTVE